MLVEIIDGEVGHRGHSSLCETGISLIETCLTDHADLTLLLSRHLQGVAHTGHSRADNKKIVLVYHKAYLLFLSCHQPRTEQHQHCSNGLIPCQDILSDGNGHQ